MGAADFQAFLQWEVSELLERLALVGATLAELHELQAEARSQELDSRRQAFSYSAAEGPTARRQAMDVEATPATQAYVETSGKIAALAEEQRFITFLIDVRTRVPAGV